LDIPASQKYTRHYKYLSNIKIPVPDKDIQKKIITEIEAIEAKETKAKKVIEENTLKIDELFVKYQSKTSQTKLGNILTLEYGKSLSAKNRIMGEYPVYGSNGIDGFHNEFLIEGPSIIVGRKGSAGKVNWSKNNCWPIDTTFYVKPKKNGYSLKYMFYLLSSVGLDRDELVKSTGVPGLNRNNAYQQDIEFLDIKYHIEFENEILLIEKEIQNQEQAIANTEEEKKAILTKYLEK